MGSLGSAKTRTRKLLVLSSFLASRSQKIAFFFAATRSVEAGAQKVQILGFYYRQDIFHQKAFSLFLPFIINSTAVLLD